VRTTRDGEVAAVLGNTDWTGVGQDIYDHAISNPRGPVDGEPRSSKTSESTFCGTSRAGPLKKTFPTCSTTLSSVVWERRVHWDDFTLAQAATLIGMNASTARTRYVRAKERLAAQLDVVPRQVVNG